MSHEAKFKQGDAVVNAYGETAVVRDAEPDDAGYIMVNWARNPDSGKKWAVTHQDNWTKERPQYPVRWLVFGSDGAVVAFTLLESARHYATDNTLGILHVCKDGTTEWIDIEEED
tara:strand:- start:87 stop:431 length:345 start_codon:yes stop_codon:yes gene_type:complete